MSVLFSPDGSLTSTTRAAPAAGYQALRIGGPLSVELRTFYPGPHMYEWNNKSELMVSSQVRLGPRAKPPPKRVNIMVKGYQFTNAEPIQGVAGHNYGDMMLHYTKAYTGARLGLTIFGVELDRVGQKRFDQITTAMSQVGVLAMFSSAAPYLAAASLAMNVINVLVHAFSRDDPVLTVPTDLNYRPANGGVLQAGRYLFWSGTTNWRTLTSLYEIDEQNVLVKKSTGAQYESGPYLVVEIDGRKRPEYDDFEIGAQSAELLEQWGDKEAAATTLNAIVDLAKQVNDAKHLREIYDLRKTLGNAGTDEDKALIQEKIKAHAQLFTQENGAFIKEMLGL